MKIKALLLKLATPTALGLYITLTLSTTAFFYYITKDQGYRAGTLNDLISTADQLSLDYRLKFRGPRYGSDSVAILAVDDRSIDIIGRWPWPRDVMGRAIDRAYQSGTKVIAADIVWSEPSDRPDKRLVEALDKKSLLPQEVKTAIDFELSQVDPDKAFANYLEKNKSKFVLGNFYENELSWYNQPEQSDLKIHCHDIIFKSRDLIKMSERQALPPVPLDSFETYFPGGLVNYYENQLLNIESAIRDSKEKPKSQFDEFKLDSDVLRKQLLYCEEDFLNPENDDATKNLRDTWSDVKEVIPELNFPSFEEWRISFENRNPRNAVLEVLEWTLNTPIIANAGENYGYFNAKLDKDGTIRRTQLLARTGSHYFPSIALQAYLLATEQNVEVKIEPHKKILNLKGISKLSVVKEGEHSFDIPTSSDGLMLINYAGSGTTIPHASIADLLNENDPNVTVSQKVYKKDLGWIDNTKQVPKNIFFKDKILVLGATAIGVFDLRVTPFDENFPGVETHANVIDNLLRQDFLSKNADEDIYMPAFMLALGLVISLSLSHAGAISGLVFTVLLAAAIAFVDRIFLFGKGHLVSIFFPLFQVIFTYVFLTFYKYLTEERSKKELRATFSKYVSPAIVEEILQDPKNLELGGRKERVTVFFSDVRGFTTISEKLDPKALSDLLNSYLTPMTEIVFKNQGTLDKYMGDAIMAFFGAPVHYPNHAVMACRCALDSMEKLKELAAQYAEKGLPQIDIGIGLNTGECNVGNMGSETVRSYTVMGDAVNLASRLEGINKTYGTHIIISEFTYEEVKNEFLCREVDWVRVKGKLKPVKIFELLAETKADEKIKAMAERFSTAYELYHKKQFDKAILEFNRAIEANPNDETSKIYIERCQEFIAEPPPTDWDGVYVMKTK